MRRPPGVKAQRPAVSLSAEEAAFIRSRVIHQDEHILALDKPSGLSSQGGRGQVHTLDELLSAFAKPSGVRPRLIHRLDRDTSGVILTARSQPAAAFLGKAMMGRRFKKTYLALTQGPPEPAQGVVDKPLRRIEAGREAYMQVCDAGHKDAETALTRYRTLAANDTAALIELEPETGRMHQIRVQLASLGRPILGDVRYGGALTLGGAGVPRLMLHAAALSFPHPAGGEFKLTAPIPADFAEVAARAGLAISAA